MRGQFGRVFTSYDIENMSKVGGLAPNLINNIGIMVIEGVLSSITLDEVMMLLATCRQNPEAMKGCNLNRVETNARWFNGQRIVLNS